MVDEINEEIQKLVSYDFDQEEPEFSSISTDKPILIVWRIEKLKLKKWPEERIGTFYEGDSFLILNIKSADERSAHVWTGKKSEKDEISFVSYKVLQLDKKLDNSLEIYYESQGKESELFKSYFEFYTIIKGGIDSNLEQFESKDYKAKLFHVHSVGSKIQLREITINRKYLDSSDVYLLDTGLKVFIWIGNKSNSFEKFHMACLAKKINSLRNNKVTLITIYEECKDNIDIKNKKQFDEIMDKYEVEDAPEKKESFYTGERRMMKLSDESGKFEMTEITYSKDNLETKDSFLIDRGDALIIWVGKEASKKEKKFARFYAKKYINKEKRSANLPIYVTNEGKNSQELEKCFS